MATVAHRMLVLGCRQLQSVNSTRSRGYDGVGRDRVLTIGGHFLAWAAASSPRAWCPT
jgi:hypothetical protein